MIRLRDLERHLRQHGCGLLREGGRHSIWLCEGTGQRTSVPRHRELPRTTAREICKQLGIPPI
jgi:predicted RNA binding protein YcfA (HicA-like mRNA interferase family)